jgi:hypothetical protein
VEGHIDTAIKRGRGYWFVDGFTEIVSGVLFLLLGGAVLLVVVISKASFITNFFSITGDIAILKIFGLIAAVLVLWWLKDQFTYPRTGYARVKQSLIVQIFAFIRNAVLVLILPLLGLVAALTFLPPVRIILISMPAWLPSILGMLAAIFFISSGRWMGLRRFQILGAWVLLAGFLIGIWQLSAGFPSISIDALKSASWNALPDSLRDPFGEILRRTFVGIGVWTAICGVFLSISGWATFLGYRKENPLPYKEEK